MRYSVFHPFQCDGPEEKDDEYYIRIDCGDVDDLWVLRYSFYYTKVYKTPREK